jgi:hypothetical protein
MSTLLKMFCRKHAASDATAGDHPSDAGWRNPKREVSVGPQRLHQWRGKLSESFSQRFVFHVSSLRKEETSASAKLFESAPARSRITKIG